MSEVQNFSHLYPAYQRYAGLSDEERIAWIKADRWIGFDQTGAALDRLDALLAYPPRDRMPCLLIYGDTGMGKTKFIRKLQPSSNVLSGHRGHTSPSGGDLSP